MQVIIDRQGGRLRYRRILQRMFAGMELMQKWPSGSHGGTYGGNPVACQAALAVLEVYEEEGLLEKAEVLGEKLRTRLDAWYEQFEIIGDVRGIGPMQALELVKDRETKVPAADEAKTIVAYCHDKGLIINVCGTFSNVIRFLMPLVITDEDLGRGLSILEDAFYALTKN